MDVRGICNCRKENVVEKIEGAALGCQFGSGDLLRLGDNGVVCVRFA